jgi:hypothetical protein
MVRRRSSGAAIRAELAAAAARLLADGEVADFDHARRRAAREHGASRELPDHGEIHRALIDHLAMFHAAEQLAHVSALRQVALRAMELLAPFEPHLVGAVLYGTATATTPITLHLVSDEFEAVVRYLLERRVTYELGDTRVLAAGANAPQSHPLIGIVVEGEAVELLVLPSRGALRHPRSRLDGRPCARADRGQVNELLRSGQTFFPVAHA